METPIQIRSAVESEIQLAFRDVTLGQGISFRRAHLVNDAARNEYPMSPAHGDITDDWSRIPKRLRLRLLVLLWADVPLKGDCGPYVLLVTRRVTGMR